MKPLLGWWAAAFIFWQFYAVHRHPNMDGFQRWAYSIITAVAIYGIFY